MTAEIASCEQKQTLACRTEEMDLGKRVRDLVRRNYKGEVGGKGGIPP